MKKVILLGMALLAVFAVQAVAEDIDLERYGGYYTGTGGEFTVEILGTYLSDYLALYDAKTKNIKQNPSFQSFCLETDEYIDDYGNDGFFAILSNKAQLGGANTNSGDPISVGTAWLYSQFAIGVLGDYTYAPGSGRSASAGLLQNAIWMLEDEIAYNGANPFIQRVEEIFGSFANAKADFTGSYVKVLNIYDDAGDPNRRNTLNRQDMLIYVPDGGLTVMLLGIGLGSLAFFSRKLRK